MPGARSIAKGIRTLTVQSIPRAVVYARYSSDSQRDASVDDQIRICKELITREGWSLSEVFIDRALSGASTLRPAYHIRAQHRQQRRHEAPPSGSSAIYGGGYRGHP